MKRSELEALAAAHNTKLCRCCVRFAIPGYAECADHIAILEFRYKRVIT